MKIAIFSDNFYPEISGISDSILITSKELARRGHEITIYAPRYVKKNYEKVNLPEKEISLGRNINVVRLPSLPLKTGTNQSRMVIPLGFSLRKIWKNRPDVIHVHLPFGVGFEGLMASKIFRIPMVGTEHTVIKEFFKSEFIGNLVEKYNIWFFKNCNFLSAPAKFLLKNSGVLKREVIPNPVDLSLFKNNIPNRKKYSLSDFVVLYCGRLAPEKKIDVIIRAIAKARKDIPEIRLVILGIGSSESDLRLLAKKLNIEDKINFLGYLRGKDLAEAYLSGDVFAIMSTSEVHSLAVMQAMSSAMPIVAAKSNGLKEHVGPDTGFLIKPGDFNELAKRLIYLYKNRNIRVRLGANGKKAMENFSPSAVADLWERVYKKVINDYNMC
ncbi:MAG: glycosyltransferase [archaeon]